MDMCKIPELPATIVAAQEKFEVALHNAAALDIVNNFGAAFGAAQVIMLLREALTPEVMNTIFMPLMNSKVGFRTDRDGKPDKNGRVKPLYDVDTVREAIIDAALIGLRPTSNQFNIISGTMYPTKEGYTALLKKIGAKYIIDYSQPAMDSNGFATFLCKINYEYKGEKKSFTVSATVRTDQYSSYDQLRGKAERRAKKALYEYLTGTDYGDADEGSSAPIDVVAVDISENANKGPRIGGQPQEPKPTPTPEPQRVQETPRAAQQPPTAQPIQQSAQPQAPQPGGYDYQRPTAASAGFQPYDCGF